MDSKTFLKGEALSPRTEMFFSSTTRVQYTIRSCLKSKVNLSATVCVDNSFAAQHRKHWLVRYFGSANFSSYGTNHQLLLKNNHSKTSSCYHCILFPFESLSSTIFCVLIVVSRLLVAVLWDPKKHKMLYKWYKHWRNYNSVHFIGTPAVMETLQRPP